jgi:hypothetical protein
MEGRSGSRSGRVPETDDLDKLPGSPDEAPQGRKIGRGPELPSGASAPAGGNLEITHRLWFGDR